MLKKIFLTALVIGLPLFGDIIESDKIKTILPFIKQDSLVLLNLSDVLYEHESALAEGQFREYFIERAHALIANKEASDKLINKVRGLFVTKLPKKNVEEGTPAFVKSLQDKRIVVLGITDRNISTPYSANYASVTSHYLTDLDIHLEQTLTYRSLPKKQITDDYAFIDGIIFTGKNPAGLALTTFFQKNNYYPKQVVMVDNLQNSLEEAEQAMNKLGIGFKGLRYSPGDNRKAKFDLSVGIIEFFALVNDNKVMSDDEALKIKLKNPGVDYKKQLDDYILKNKEYVKNE